MKKNLFILAAAALAFASCSSDETVESAALSKSNEINFRPLLTSATRSANAAGVKSAFESGDIINVYADYKSGKYFQDNFTHDGSYFSSAQKYYWPNDVTSNHVTFTAIWGATQKADNPGKIENYSPAAAAANQKDILVAKHVSSDKEAQVTLNFRHALSQIYVNAKNTNPNLKVTISGVRIGYVKTASTSSTSPRPRPRIPPSWPAPGSSAPLPPTGLPAPTAQATCASCLRTRTTRPSPLR